MSRNSYYCLVSGLSELALDQKKIPFVQIDFRKYLKDNLYKVDYKLIELLYLRYDMQNMLNLLLEKDKPFDERALFTEEELQEIKSTKEIEISPGMPGSFYDFLLNFTICYKNEITLYEGLSWENQFTAYYYDFAINTDNDFLKEWLSFEKALHNVTAGINARNHEKDVNKEIIGKDEVANAILNVKAKDFGMGGDHAFVDRLLDAFDNNNLMEREQEIDLLKWEKLDELTTFFYFTIEVVLAYTIKIGMLERWQKLDKQAGQEMFDRLVNELTSSYEFSKEFDVNG